MQRATRSPASQPPGSPSRASPRWPPHLWLRHLRCCRLTSFLGNQLIYCPFFVQGAVTVPVAILQTPGLFVTALQSGDLLKAIGAAAASVTGAADAAATPAIISDGTIGAPRALNAFEVGVVGLLNIVPAAAGGLPAVVTAIDTARQDTFTALNRPVVANPTPTVAPHGVVQVGVMEGINVVAAVISRL